MRAEHAVLWQRFRLRFSSKKEGGHFIEEKSFSRGWGSRLLNTTEGCALFFSFSFLNLSCLRSLVVFDSPKAAFDIPNIPTT